MYSVVFLSCLTSQQIMAQGTCLKFVINIAEMMIPCFSFQVEGYRVTGMNNLKYSLTVQKNFGLDLSFVM